MKKSIKLEKTSFSLHIMAMRLALCDQLKRCNATSAGNGEHPCPLRRGLPFYRVCRGANGQGGALRDHGPVRHFSENRGAEGLFVYNPDLSAMGKHEPGFGHKLPDYPQLEKH